MRKITNLFFTSLLLIIAVSASSIVEATEKQTDKQPTTSAYSNADGIPTEEMVTLDNGESFEIKKVFAFFIPPHSCVIDSYFRAQPLGGIYSAYSLEMFSTTTDKLPYTRIVGADDKLMLNPHWNYRPETPEIHNVTFRITNYSAAPVTFYLHAYINYLFLG